MLALAVGEAGVSTVDALIFAAYALAFLTFPGTVVWRAVARPGPSLGNDLILGTILGLVLEAPVYLVLRWVGVTWLLYAYPLIVLAVVVVRLRRRGRGLQLRLGRPSGWSWAAAGVVVVQLLTVAKFVWHARPVGDLRSEYVDEPFHLAIAGDLLHHFPAQMPWVDGVPLYYHWLVYVHLASAATVTHVELVVLLRTLSIALFIVLALGGIYAAAVRLTGLLWPGFVAVLVLGLGGPPDFLGWTGLSAPKLSMFYTASRAVASPTHAFVVTLQVVLLVVVVEALRRERWRAAPWALTALVMLAVSGAKSSALPTILGGLFLVVVVAAITRNRRILLAGGVLFATAAVVFLFAQHFFYGGGSRALTPSLTATAERYAATMHPGGGDSASLTAAVWLSFLVGLGLAVFAGLAWAIRGGWRNGGWRSPELQFVLGTYVVAAGAFMLLSHPSFSQYYFLAGAAPFVALLPALALAHFLPHGVDLRNAVALIACAAVGYVVLAVTGLLTGSSMPPSVGAAASRLLIALAVGLALLVAAGALVVVMVRRASDVRLPVAAVLVALVLGVSLAGAPEIVDQAAAGPTSARLPADGAVGVGGVAAARYVRAHSGTDDVVATNAHCHLPGAQPACDHRNFWLAAFAERRVLVEGWAYVDPHVVGLPSTPANNSATLPFWDQQRLKDNNAAFTRPDAGTLSTLAEHYGVDWLVVDRRYPNDLAGLRTLLEPVFKRGKYVVFRLDAAELR